MSITGRQLEDRQDERRMQRKKPTDSPEMLKKEEVVMLVASLVMFLLWQSCALPVMQVLYVYSSYYIFGSSAVLKNHTSLLLRLAHEML